MPGFPVGEIVHGQFVIGIRPAGGSDIENHRGDHQILDGNLVDRAPILSKMNGRIQMRASMLRG